MSYTKRLMVAAHCALVLHIAILLPSGCPGVRPLDRLVARSKPIVLNLQPAEPPAPRRLVETNIPATTPVEPTDLISDRNSKATDLSEVEGRRPAPYFETPAAFDSLGGALAPEPAPPVAEPPADRPAAQEVPQPEPAKQEAVEAADALALADEARATESSPERVQVARAPSPPQIPTVGWGGTDVGEARGRVDGGVRAGKGFVGFEALEDETAPYLLEVRKRVGRKWYAALSLRYSGTSPTKAVVDCVISPTGEVLEATIVEPGSSPSYAPLCKEAIERAGPFPPFPFKVPDVYRTKNLEIRWTFSFVR